MLPPALLGADRAQALITKPIPSTGRKLPVIGLGTANEYGRADYDDVRDVLKRLHELRGTVIDTAAMYRGSEETVGTALAELELLKDMFIATKLNAPGGQGEPGGLESFERSMQRLVALKVSADQGTVRDQKG